MVQSEALWWLGQHLLMATALATAVLVICRLFRPSPAARHILWLLVLCRLIVPSVGIWPWSIPIGIPAVNEPPPPIQTDVNSVVTDVGEFGATFLTRPLNHVPDSVPDLDDRQAVRRRESASNVSSAAPTITTAKPRPFLRLSWQLAVAGLWIIGSVAVVLLLVRRIRRVSRLLNSERDSDAWLQHEIGEWCRLLQVRTPDCVVTERFRSPFLWCLGRVRLVWPGSLAKPEQREQARPIIVHELAHLKRRDHWTTWVELVALVVWWWNPLFWFVRRQLRTTSEMACDAWVVQLLPDERRAYAESLVEFSVRIRIEEFAIGAVGANSGSRRTFQRRLEMIMNEQVSAGFSKRTMVAVVLLGLISLPAFSTELESQSTNELTAGSAVDAPSDSASAIDETVDPSQRSQNAVAEPQNAQAAPVAAQSASEPAGDGNSEPSPSLQEVLEQIENNYYGEVDRGQLEQAAIEAIMSSLDGESQILSPEELSAALKAVEGDLAGVGIAINIDSETNQPVVTRPILRSPAQAAGIRAGDIIVSVDGESTTGMILNEMVERLRGPRGSAVTLLIRRGDETQDVEVVRDNFAVSRVEPWSVSAEGAEDYWIDRAAHIGYVHIPAFTRQTGSQLRQVLTDLNGSGVEGLLLDLRDCPGGLLTAAAEVADLFIEDGTIVSSRGQNESHNATFQATADGTFSDLRVAVLVNGMTASAAEIVAACLQDHRRAAIVGEQTYGRGIVQALFPLNDGGALKLTTAQWLRPNGSNLHRYEESDDWGVTPGTGLEVPLSDDDRQRLINVRERRLAGEAVDPDDDPQLKIAVGWLQLG